MHIFSNLSQKGLQQGSCRLMQDPVFQAIHTTDHPDRGCVYWWVLVVTSYQKGYELARLSIIVGKARVSSTCTVDFTYCCYGSRAHNCSCCMTVQISYTHTLKSERCTHLYIHNDNYITKTRTGNNKSVQSPTITTVVSCM